MPVSINSVIHYTKNKTSLKHILKSGFRLKYCTEYLSLTSNKTVEYAVPMVSFCDIPLSQIKDHASKYGEYGIGLSKSWAIKNMLSPVQYVAKDSAHATSLRTVLNKWKPEGGLWKDLTSEEQAMMNIPRFMKMYQGDLHRGEKVYKAYRFYDEREWRYVPVFSEDFPMSISEKDYLKNKNHCNELLNQLFLKFQPSDIQYIIIKNEKEISEFISYVRKIYGDEYSLDDIERLSTRLITQDQIKSDF